MKKTREGHEIKAGECYQVRNGQKMFVSGFKKNGLVIGLVQGEHSTRVWSDDGLIVYYAEYPGSDYDIMRPWSF